MCPLGLRKRPQGLVLLLSPMTDALRSCRLLLRTGHKSHIRWRALGWFVAFASSAVQCVAGHVPRGLLLPRRPSWGQTLHKSNKVEVYHDDPFSLQKPSALPFDLLHRTSVAHAETNSEETISSINPYKKKEHTFSQTARNTGKSVDVTHMKASFTNIF